MTAERRQSMERNTELVVDHLTEYLSIRFDQAARINPALTAIKQDLTFHELSKVRRALSGTKIYGPNRAHVIDVILGDNEKRRMNLMSRSDQTSIQVELVSHVQDHRVEATRGQIKFHDLKTFYAAINPTLTDFIDLIETWIWWDILDAAELVRFEQKMGKIKHIQAGKMTPEMRRRYAALLNPATAEDEGEEQEAQQATKVTDEDVIRYEADQMAAIHRHWVQRRSNDLGHHYVLKRDELPLPGEGELIHRIADKVREYDSVEQLETIDEDLTHRYAPALRMPPQKVTREQVLEFIKSELVELERQMLVSNDSSDRLGPPYNYKERQALQMERLLQDLRRQLGLNQANVTPATGEPDPAPPAN